MKRGRVASKPHSELAETVRGRIMHDEGSHPLFSLGRNPDCSGCQAETALDSLIEQFEVYEKALQELSLLGFRQYLDWMHFHEVAMAKPFDAEVEAQDFARRVGSLADIALGDKSPVEVSEVSTPAKERS